MANRIQLRRDTTANWVSENPILAQGEIGLDLTTDTFKIGNGTDDWLTLPYFTSGGGGGGGGLAGTRIVTGTTDTPTATDKDKLVRYQNSGTTTVTLAAGSFASLDEVNLNAEGGGVLIVPDGGQTFIPSGNKTLPPGQAATAIYLGSNTWVLIGGFKIDAVNVKQVLLGSDVTNNNSTANTIADVTGLSFPVVAGVRYHFRFVIRYTAAATTTGSRWSINGPASPTELVYRAEYSLTTTSRTTIEGSTAYNLPAASNATSAATAGNMAIIEGVIVPSTSGNVIARFASEVASSAIVAKAGSFVDYRELS